MLNDMKEHVSKNGGIIVWADRPLELRFAATCTTGKSWSIKIADIKNSINKMGAAEADRLKIAITSQEGKQSLIDVINGK